jgi:hypothetical protein
MEGSLSGSRANTAFFGLTTTSYELLVLRYCGVVLLCANWIAGINALLQSSPAALLCLLTSLGVVR